MRTNSRTLKTAVGVTAVALGVGVTASLTGSAQAAVNPAAASSVYALAPDGLKLSSFNPANVADLNRLGSIRGLSGDTKIVGIDMRIQDKKLYGVGNAGGIYTISSSAAATKESQLSTELSGTRFSVDFNPAADRLRVVSNTGQNLRHNLGDDTTTVDGTLAYTAGTPTTGINGVAYTNNDLSANTTTQLYDIDVTRAQLANQNPANAGTLVQVGKLMLGITDTVGFDIDSTLKGAQTGRNVGYVVVRRSAEPFKPLLYQIDVTSGALTKVPGNLSRDVADIAVVLG